MAKKRGNNEGSIYRRASGRWSAQVSLEGGRLSQTFDSRRECQEWVKQTLDQIENGLSFAGVKWTVADYLQYWLETTKPFLKLKTWLQYEGIVRNHLTPQIGKIKLMDRESIFPKFFLQ